MAIRLICLLILIVFTVLSQQASKPGDSTYIAGVVEFHPANASQTSQAQVENNLHGYLEIIRSPEADDVDIIVFPELTLNNVKHMTFVPRPERKIIPCANPIYAPFFQDLSCVAGLTKKYIVINVLEEEPCSPFSQIEVYNDPRDCAPNNMSVFNTNVVFDRNGAVVARYRKFNIYGEPRNSTYRPDYSTFVTDFGVEFGLFTCFDINFYSPAMDLVKRGVKNLIFTSFWYSELPFLTAVQLQHSWAYANNVNLLAAGASYPAIGSTGTGIYSGKQGALVSVMAGIPERKLYIAQVPKNPDSYEPKDKALSVRKTRNNNPGGIRLMQEYKIHEYKSLILEPHPDLDKFRETICHNEFCCKFKIEYEALSAPSGTISYIYRVAAYEGDRQYSGNGYTEYKVCAILACTNYMLSSCGMVFGDSLSVYPDYVITKIKVHAMFPQAEKVLFMPTSLDQNLYPLPVEYSEFEAKQDSYDKHQVRVTHIYTNDTMNLLTFGIYANYYNGSINYNLKSIMIIVLSVLFAILVGTCNLNFL